MTDLDRTLTVVVTGASGYLGSWIVKTALNRGHRVRGTVRDPDDLRKTQHLREMPGNERLALYRADLLESGSFDAAVDGADVVIHSASPFIRERITDPDTELIRPAVEGTRNVLAAVDRARSVTRVVLTSSVAAIVGDAAEAQAYPDRRVDETRWNRTSSREHEPYSYSKTMAERTAWEIADARNRWGLVTINPAFIVGPSLSNRLDGTSVAIMRQIGDGSFRQGAPEIYLGFVDVRDVAAAHVLAAEQGDLEGRYILSAGMFSFPQIARILRERIGDAYPFPKGRVPKWLIWAIGPSVGLTRRYVRANVGIHYEIDNTRSREELGIEYRDIPGTVTEHFRQLIELGAVRPMR
ncbi:MAG: NAD-dependent epimerase/dehydratase family protein [Alkalispirochaeta sp.]